MTAVAGDTRSNCSAILSTRVDGPLKVSGALAPVGTSLSGSGDAALVQSTIGAGRSGVSTPARRGPRRGAGRDTHENAPVSRRGR